VRTPAADEELAARQSALHAEAASLLDELDRSGVFADVGPVEVTGSYVSNLMCWRDLDVGLLVGPDYDPGSVLFSAARASPLESAAVVVPRRGRTRLLAPPPCGGARFRRSQP
jgi:hypothetical protein